LIYKKVKMTKEVPNVWCNKCKADFPSECFCELCTDSLNEEAKKKSVPLKPTVKLAAKNYLLSDSEKKKRDEFEEDQRRLNEEIERFKNRTEFRMGRRAVAQEDQNLERFIILHEERRAREIEIIKKQAIDEQDAESRLSKRIRLDEPLTRDEVKNRVQYTAEDKDAMRELSEKIAVIHFNAKRRFSKKCRAYLRVKARKPVNNDQVDWLFLMHSRF